MKANLILEDGTVFSGEHFGACREVVCEMVFNTGLTGYLELLTDASYAGQGLIMASPLIGNYGVFTKYSEAWRPWAEALVVRDLSKIADDARNAEDLESYLTRYGIPVLTKVDTRSLTLHLRDYGTMKGMITTGEDYQMDDCLRKIRQFNNDQPVPKVSCRQPVFYPAGLIGRTAELPETVIPEGQQDPDMKPGILSGQANADHTCLQKKGHALFGAVDVDDMKPESSEVQGAEPPLKIALLDFGVKQNIIWNLTRRGCHVYVFPWNTTAGEIMQIQPDGLVLSNGPGDPQQCRAVLENIKAFYDASVPILAICLGHQLLAMAHGAETAKLKYGHRGINHPVKDVESQRVTITSQNHGYVIMEHTINSAVSAVSHIHVNDGSVEGLRYPGKPVISVQFHPEGAPGPQDSEYLFNDFLTLMANENGGV